MGSIHPKVNGVQLHPRRLMSNGTTELGALELHGLVGDDVIERLLARRAGRKDECGERRRGVVDGFVGRVFTVADDEGQAAVGALVAGEPGTAGVVVERERRERSGLGLGRETRARAEAAVVVAGGLEPRRQPSEQRRGHISVSPNEGRT